MGRGFTTRLATKLIRQGKSADEIFDALTEEGVNATAAREWANELTRRAVREQRRQDRKPKGLPEAKGTVERHILWKKEYEETNREISYHATKGYRDRRLHLVR